MPQEIINWETPPPRKRGQSKGNGRIHRLAKAMMENPNRWCKVGTYKSGVTHKCLEGDNFERRYVYNKELNTVELFARFVGQEA